MTLAEAELGELSCLKKLKDIESEAPQQRIEHLKSCLDKAQEQQDVTKKEAIIRILRR